MVKRENKKVNKQENNKTKRNRKGQKKKRAKNVNQSNKQKGGKKEWQNEYKMGGKKGEVSGKLLRYAIGRMSDAWKSSCKLLGDASGQRCGQGRPYRRPQCSIHRAGPCVLPAFLQTKWQTPAAPVVSRTKGTKVHPAALQIETRCVSFFDSATLAARPGSAAGRPLDGASGWTIEISTAVGVAYRPVTWMSAGRRSQSGVGEMWGTVTSVLTPRPRSPSAACSVGIRLCMSTL